MLLVTFSHDPVSVPDRVSVLMIPSSETRAARNLSVQRRVRRWCVGRERPLTQTFASMPLPIAARDNGAGPLESLGRQSKMVQCRSLRDVGSWSFGVVHT